MAIRVEAILGPDYSLQFEDGMRPVQAIDFRLIQRPTRGIERFNRPGPIVRQRTLPLMVARSNHPKLRER